nr:hypothetical protein [Tanacetum cinerariifolium]
MKFIYEVGELRAVSGHVLGATGVQIPENNLDNVHSIVEEDGTLKIRDPQDLLGLDVLLSRGIGFLRGTLAVVVILVKGYAFPTIVKVLPVGCDPLALVGKFNPVEDIIGCAQLSQDFETQFVLQTDLSTKQAFWSQNSMNSNEPNLSTRPTQVEIPKELPKVSMVNTSLKKLKHHLASFDVVIKERTTATAITEGMWGFEHTKACFRDEIVLFLKALKDLFNSFDQFLIDKLSHVQNVFYQMEQTIEQHRVESKGFQVKMNNVLNENERLLEQAISKDIVNIVVTSTVNNA